VSGLKTDNMEESDVRGVNYRNEKCKLPTFFDFKYIFPEVWHLNFVSALPAIYIRFVV
jgi:hypothetical protein